MQKQKFRVIGTLMKTIKVGKESFQYVKGLETKKGSMPCVTILWDANF